MTDSVEEKAADSTAKYEKRLRRMPSDSVRPVDNGNA